MLGMTLALEGLERSMEQMLGVDWAKDFSAETEARRPLEPDAGKLAPDWVDNGTPLLIDCFLRRDDELRCSITAAFSYPETEPTKECDFFLYLFYSFCYFYERESFVCQKTHTHTIVFLCFDARRWIINYNMSRLVFRVILFYFAFFSFGLMCKSLYLVYGYIA